MPKKAKELGALAVSRLTKPGFWAVGGVAGLSLQVTRTGARSWVLRTVIAGKRRDMGLGGFPDVSLAGAIAAARVAKEAIRTGTDPIEERRANRSKLKSEREAALTFAQAATAYIKLNEVGWRSAKHGDQWRNTLATYATPVIGDMLVRDVKIEHVRRILEPIWTEKTETARRLRNRIELVYSWAMAVGAASGPNPAAWKGNLAQVLPKPSKVSEKTNHAAIHYREAAAFMRALQDRAGTAARALEFLILTAARSGEVRGAKWSEIDFDSGIWRVPAERMKRGREHRQPLSPAAIELLKSLPRNSELIFPAPRGGTLSDMSLLAVTRRMGVAAVPHGFRSTFRDWAGDCTGYPREICEMALAHVVANETELSYWRSDVLQKRANLMADWAKFLRPPAAGPKVVQMAKRRIKS